MKAILIDTENKTLTEIEIEANLESYYKAIDCRCITVGTYLENGDCIYVDDEGLFSDSDFFEIKGAHQPFRGNGLVVGTNDEGETVSCTSTSPYLEVSFLTTSQVRNKFGY